jgi:hypothetical protein
MMMTRFSNPRGNRLRTGGLLVALVVASLGVVASPALAKEPTGNFARFKHCPRFTPGVVFCTISEISSGEVTIGSSTVPIEKATLTLQGGYTFNEETEEEKFVGAEGAETLSKTPLKVPGGLAGIIKCNEIKGTGLLEKLTRASCELVFENLLTGVNATTELALPPSSIGINSNNLANENGTALSLPVKVHLENPLLGSECYIGSASKPVILNLTTGKTSPNPPNTSIKGSVGDLKFSENFEIIELIGATLVDNAFSAPEATGCGGIASGLIDPIVNSKLGLPSPDGKNAAIQKGNIYSALAENVIKSEK